VDWWQGKHNSELGNNTQFIVISICKMSDEEKNQEKRKDVSSGTEKIKKPSKVGNLLLNTLNKHLYEIHYIYFLNYC